MLTAAGIAAELSNVFSQPPGTVFDRLKPMRARGMFSKGVQSPGRGAVMTNRDAVNALLAIAIDHKRGDDVAENVQRFRDLPLSDKTVIGMEGGTGALYTSTWRGGFLFDLTFMRETTFGAALDALFADIRSGEYARLEAAGDALSLGLDTGNADAFLSLSRANGSNAAGLWHLRADKDPHRALAYRQTWMRGEMFFRLATALGPPS